MASKVDVLSRIDQLFSPVAVRVIESQCSNVCGPLEELIPNLSRGTRQHWLDSGYARLEPSDEVLIQTAYALLTDVDKFKAFILSLVEELPEYFESENVLCVLKRRLFDLGYTDIVQVDQPYASMVEFYHGVLYLGQPFFDWPNLLETNGHSSLSHPIQWTFVSEGLRNMNLDYRRLFEMISEGRIPIWGALFDCGAQRGFTDPRWGQWIFEM